LAARTAFSSAGPRVRQGPHQVAQKSTITGWVFDASITSFMKEASVPSLIRSPDGRGSRVGSAKVMGKSVYRRAL